MSLRDAKVAVRVPRLAGSVGRRTRIDRCDISRLGISLLLAWLPSVLSYTRPPSGNEIAPDRRNTPRHHTNSSPGLKEQRSYTLV